MELREALYQARKRSGMTQDELAEALGVSHQSVSKWELGDCCPDAQKLITIAGVYGISIDQLCRGEVGAVSAPSALPETKKPDKGKRRMLCGIGVLLCVCALSCGGFFLGRGTVRTAEPAETDTPAFSSLPLPEEVTITTPAEFSVLKEKNAILFCCDCSAAEVASDYTYRILAKYESKDGMTEIAFPATRISDAYGITAEISVAENSIIGTDCRLRNIVLSVSDGLNERWLPLAELMEYDHFTGNIYVSWV